MHYIREQDVEGDRIGPPNQRVIRHLVTPENMGSKYLWLGTSSVDPGFTSNAHAHEYQEEVFYCVQAAAASASTTRRCRWSRARRSFARPRACTS